MEDAHDAATTRPAVSVVICAYNEQALLPACLHAVLAQTRPPDEILVLNNASSDQTGEVARSVPGVRVVDERRKGLVIAREADCRPPIFWLERIERHLLERPTLVGLTGPYRYCDWDWLGRALVRAYDVLVAPPTHFLVHHLLQIGAIFDGGNFAVSRVALEQIEGFDATIELHGEDTPTVTICFR
jgi:glycosyltransferase involved in cell wall biosynthesis